MNTSTLKVECTEQVTLYYATELDCAPVNWGWERRPVELSTSRC